MAINIEVVQDQTTVEVATAGVQGLPGASGMPITTFDSTPTWRSARHMNNGAAGSNLNGQMNLAPFPLPVAATLTGISCHVWTAGVTNAFVNTVLYSDNGSFFPGALIVQTGDISALTTGAKALTFAGIVLPAGLYWTGVLHTGTGTMSGPMQAQYGNEYWTSMPYGTGAIPTFSQGNDGNIAGYTSGLVTPPATFAGAYRTNSNAPLIPTWTALRLNR